MCEKDFLERKYEQCLNIVRMGTVISFQVDYEYFLKKEIKEINKSNSNARNVALFNHLFSTRMY